MSAARVQSNFSNRAKARLAVERKTIFKSVLENPFQVKWPSVPVNLQNICLARLLASLESLPRHKCARPGRSQTDQGARPDPGDQHLDVLVGINQVTKVLERQIQSVRTLAVLSGDPGPHQGTPALAAVFICSADIDPLILAEHIPHLVASCNSLAKQGPGKVKLVPLPKGSESAVAHAVGLRRAAAIGVLRNSPMLVSLKDVLDGIPDLMAPWLSSEPQQQRLVPTHIKQLRTTCPRDMRAAKEKRVQARREAKRASHPAARKRKRLILSTDSEMGPKA